MILVDVYVPSTNRQYDFKLDEHTLIAELIDGLAERMIPAAEDPDGEKAAHLLLCSYETGRVLPLTNTLYECGIGNGSRLMFL